MNSPLATRRERRRMALLAALVGSLLFPGAAAAATGVCTSAEIVEPFRLPDGPLQSPSRLTLCERGEFSPVASFHEVRIDGLPIGLLTSRRETSEDGSRETPFLMFIREADGRLTLLGYAYPTRDGMRTYAFPAAPAREAARTEPAPGAVPLVLVASRLD